MLNKKIKNIHLLALVDCDLDSNTIVLSPRLADKLAKDMYIVKYPMDKFLIIKLSDLHVKYDNILGDCSSKISKDIASKLGLDYLVDAIVLLENSNISY